jgi:putative nucleotidyltransferase with HDIG domain
MSKKLFHRIQEVNMELWLLLSLFAIAALLNFIVALHRVVLGFYVLPTLFSAYYYGKRHATMTALASVCLVTLIAYFNPALFGYSSGIALADSKWFDITAWGATLVVTGYAMGTLYDRKELHFKELRRAYDGVMMILQQFIAKDKPTLNHSYRVSVYAMRIGACLGLSDERLEDIRAAALLHDIGKMKISRELLYKAARLTKDEYEHMQTHVDEGAHLLEPVGGTLHRVIPIILAHHDKFDGSGYHPTRGEEIPIEARIISVADVYDALTSDRPYRHAIPPSEAREIIVNGAGMDFDPKVVEAFKSAFSDGLMEVPEVLV